MRKPIGVGVCFVLVGALGSAILAQAGPRTRGPAGPTGGDQFLEPGKSYTFSWANGTLTHGTVVDSRGGGKWVRVKTRVGGREAFHWVNLDHVTTIREESDDECQHCLDRGGCPYCLGGDLACQKCLGKNICPNCLRPPQPSGAERPPATGSPPGP
jgi:hypothetical protein